MKKPHLVYGAAVLLFLVIIGVVGLFVFGLGTSEPPVVTAAIDVTTNTDSSPTVNWTDSPHNDADYVTGTVWLRSMNGTGGALNGTSSGVEFGYRSAFSFRFNEPGQELTISSTGATMEGGIITGTTNMSESSTTRSRIRGVWNNTRIRYSVTAHKIQRGETHSTVLLADEWLVHENGTITQT